MIAYGRVFAESGSDPLTVRPVAKRTLAPVELAYDGVAIARIGVIARIRRSSCGDGLASLIGLAEREAKRERHISLPCVERYQD